MDRCSRNSPSCHTTTSTVYLLKGLCSAVVDGVTRNIVCLFREPDAGNLPVRFDEREQETEPGQTGLRRAKRKPNPTATGRLTPLRLFSTLLAIALIDRAESEKPAINSPSKLGILEGVFGPFECAKARWGKGFGSLTSKLTRQRSDWPRPTRPEVIARKSTSLRRAPGFRGIAGFAQDPVQKSD